MYYFTDKNTGWVYYDIIECPTKITPFKLINLTAKKFGSTRTNPKIITCYKKALEILVETGGDESQLWKCGSYRAAEDALYAYSKKVIKISKYLFDKKIKEMKGK